MASTVRKFLGGILINNKIIFQSFYGDSKRGSEMITSLTNVIIARNKITFATPWNCLITHNEMKNAHNLKLAMHVYQEKLRKCRR